MSVVFLKPVHALRAQWPLMLPPMFLLMVLLYLLGYCAGSVVAMLCPHPLDCISLRGPFIAVLSVWWTGSFHLNLHSAVR